MQAGEARIRLSRPCRAAPSSTTPASCSTSAPRSIAAPRSPSPSTPCSSPGAKTPPGSSASPARLGAPPAAARPPPAQPPRSAVSSAPPRQHRPGAARRRADRRVGRRSQREPRARPAPLRHLRHRAPRRRERGHGRRHRAAEARDHLPPRVASTALSIRRRTQASVIRPDNNRHQCPAMRPRRTATEPNVHDRVSGVRSTFLDASRASTTRTDLKQLHQETHVAEPRT
jgi:hypothetical protein